MNLQIITTYPQNQHLVVDKLIKYYILEEIFLKKFLVIHMDFLELD